MVEQMLAENMLLGGFDTGNTKEKISFINSNGDVESFSIPTIIAEAPPTKVDLKSSSSKKDLANGMKDEDVELLHVRILSNSLDADAKNRAWYVGAYAKDKDKRTEPTVDANGKTEEKFSQANKKLHLIPLLTSMAIAALRTNREEVIVPFSGGMPIEDYKLRGEDKILDMLYGDHIVEFIDGTYEGKTVKIKINSGTINAEGVTSILALMFDIKNGEIVEVEGADQEIGDNFAINDLGAGTDDHAFFEDGELNKTLSTNGDVGTNKYIDEVLSKIKDRFMENEMLRNYMSAQEAGPFRTREEFIQVAVMPEISKYIEAEVKKPKEEYTMKFEVKWGPVKLDVTDIVLEGMNKYAQDEKDALMNYWFKTNAEKMIVVGGGVLFGYIGLKELRAQNGFVLPKNIEESPYFTSKSYLIANLLEQLSRFGIEA